MSKMIIKMIIINLHELDNSALYTIDIFIIANE